VVQVVYIDLSIDIILRLQVRNADPVFGPWVSYFKFLLLDLRFTLFSFPFLIPDILHG